jgi:hypothetical protein
MTKYKVVKLDSSVLSIATKIISRFKEELGHIKVEDIHFAWRISKTSKYHGATRLVRGVDCMFTNKKIVMVLFLKSWKAHDEAWRSLLIYHELRHILQKKKAPGEYVLVRHNIEDFADIVQNYGVGWKDAGKFLTKLKGK